MVKSHRRRFSSLHQTRRAPCFGCLQVMGDSAGLLDVTSINPRGSFSSEPFAEERYQDDVDEEVKLSHIFVPFSIDD